MMAQVEATAPLLDVNEVARRLGTEPRFVRRLVAERRIEFHKLGRHVRISEAALAEFIKAGRVPSGDICPQAGGLMPGRKSRHFGNIRKLPSGRYQARYRGPDGRLRTAPSTFGRKTDAALWLSLKWLAPEVRRGCHAACGSGWP
jgi:excisionase family DNA binding protein